jgi:hypothetical protein
VIDPSQNTSYYLGAGNTINFPAHSLCDPVNSTYGADQWDAPCPLATAPLTVSATAWLDKWGHPRIDFVPSIRFVPTLNPAGWVMMSFTDPSAALDPWFNVTYCPKKGRHCIDEGKTDPTVATMRDPVTGRVYRRVKHFSGYLVTTGEPCDPSPEDPDCVDDGGHSNLVGSFNSTVTVNATTVKGLTRDHFLPDHPTRSGDIGVLGGELYLPQAGAKLIIPAGAVSKTTHFSITSVGGRFLAYNFEPHGTRFNVPVLLVQDLRGTSHKNGGSVLGAYFADDSQLNSSTGNALVNEVLSVTLNEALHQVTLPIWHFSGYMLASGRDDD